MQTTSRKRLLTLIVLIAWTAMFVNPAKASLVFKFTGTIGSPVGNDTEGLAGANYDLTLPFTNMTYGNSYPSLSTPSLSTSTSPDFIISGSTVAGNNNPHGTFGNIHAFPNVGSNQYVTDEANFNTISILLPSGTTVVLFVPTVGSVVPVPTPGNMASANDFTAGNFPFGLSVRPNGLPHETFTGTTGTLVISSIPEPSSLMITGVMSLCCLATRRRRHQRNLAI